MALLSDSEQRLARALGRLVYCNPFLPERIDLEREVLGEQFVADRSVWSADPRLGQERPNLQALRGRTTELVSTLRQRFSDGSRGSPAEMVLYEDLVLYLLYADQWQALNELASGNVAAGKGKKVLSYARFADSLEQHLGLPGLRFSSLDRPQHIFAVFFQIRRAFIHIFDHIVGGSMAAAQLRAAVWQSIFTHDMRRYVRCLYDRLGDFTTLITGPSGTGKELVARAIALSGYIPFDPRSGQFAEDFSALFFPLNLTALSPTLIESELFGHRRGTFTGALEDRAGWLESCPPMGTVFLDEIGELDALIQVKLLRVLQSRTFQRIGDRQTRPFRGKIIAATNRDLPAEMEAGRFRRDFYYRLCSDMIATPSLAEQLGPDPDELHHLLSFITRRIAPDDADALAIEVQTWIDKHLSRDYAWPGNFRELEQCVRNVLVRREYRPPRSRRSPAEDLSDAFDSGSLTVDELIGRYCSLVYSQTGSYEQTARRVGLDRRTVKAKILAARREQV